MLLAKNHAERSEANNVVLRILGKFLFLWTSPFKNPLIYTAFDRFLDECEQSTVLTEIIVTYNGHPLKMSDFSPLLHFLLVSVPSVLLSLYS